jgi:hypothetical protein
MRSIAGVILSIAVTVRERRFNSWRTRSIFGAEAAGVEIWGVSIGVLSRLFDLDPQDTVAQTEAAEPFDHTR